VAISNYTELKAAIASRLHRTDLTTQIVDYITIAEKRLNRDLALTDQESESNLTASVGSRTMTPPATFGTPIALYLTTYLPRIEIPYVIPTEMQVLSQNGPAQYWTIDGSVIKTDAPADQAYTYTFRYLSECDIASTSTNSILDAYPETYLYGALIEAAHDIRDGDLMAISEKRYREAIQEAANDINARRNLATLSVEFVSQSKANIIRGF
jgi:hypothetical protein